MANRKSTIQADDVLGFKGVAPTVGGDHVLLKLDVDGGERVLGIRASDAVHIAVNLLACAIQAQNSKGMAAENGVLLQASDCEVVMSGNRLLLRITGESGVGFVFDFGGANASEIAARLADLSRLMSVSKPDGTHSQ